MGEPEMTGQDPDLPERAKKAVSDVASALSGISDHLKKPPKDRKSFKRHRRDEFFDEVRMFIRERYKTSRLSGDEWRFSIVVQILWKGQVIAERTFSRFEHAIRCLDYWIRYQQEDLIGEPDDHPAKIRWVQNQSEWTKKCFQPGCKEDAVSTYRLKQEYTPEGHKKDHNSFIGHIYRRFCRKHLKRGDCALEDADVNYDVVEGPGPGEVDMSGANVTESLFGGIMEI